jgi:hypothetical protein
MLDLALVVEKMISRRCPRPKSPRAVQAELYSLSADFVGAHGWVIC